MHKFNSNYVQYNAVTDVQVYKYIIAIFKQNILEMYVRRIRYRLLNTEVVVILLFTLHIQNTVVQNTHDGGCAGLTWIKTQNFKCIIFQLLCNTKMKKTITHITVLVKLTKVSYFNIIQSYQHK